MKVLFAYIASFASFLSVNANIELGDCDRNGRVDFGDIQPFIALLASGTYQEEADVNQDGVVNFLDIAPFIEALSGGGSDPEIVPLFDETTILEPETTIDTPEALITTVGDRVRDRHAREGQFQAYDHYLPFYWEQRTVSIEIVDRVAKGGTDIHNPNKNDRWFLINGRFFIASGYSSRRESLLFSACFFCAFDSFSACFFCAIQS